MFMVQPATSWLCDGVNSMASARAFERDTRTVKQVRIPVHGAGDNPVTSLPQPMLVIGATRNGAPKRATVGVQPTSGLGGVAYSNAGDARPAFSRRRAGPNDAIPLRTAGDASLRPLCSDALL